MNSIYKFILITTAIHFTGCFYLTTGYAQLPHSLSETATPVVKTYNRTSTSSTYPPLNAEWYYRVQSMGGVIPGYISYQHSKIVNDTIILSKNCMVLERTNLLNICESMGRVYEFIYKGHDT